MQWQGMVQQLLALLRKVHGRLDDGLNDQQRPIIEKSKSSKHPPKMRFIDNIFDSMNSRQVRDATRKGEKPSGNSTHPYACDIWIRGDPQGLLVRPGRAIGGLATA